MRHYASPVPEVRPRARREERASPNRMATPQSAAGRSCRLAAAGGHGSAVCSGARASGRRCGALVSPSMPQLML
eukprot:5788162-Alexandrium_andersonii.AAC.1